MAAAILMVALAAGGAVLIATRDAPRPSTVPARGEIWFGEAYDPTTFAIRGRTDSVRPNATFAMVAHAMRPVDEASILVRTLRNGTLVRTTGPDPRWNSGELLGFSLTAPLSQGRWRYEVTDLGGTLLAAGAVEVR